MTNLIPAPPGIVARFVHNKGTPQEHYTYKRIYFFDQAGDALVIADQVQKRLKTAGSYSNFDGICEDPNPLIVAIAPASGYWVEFTSGDGSKFSDPLVGWGLKADGDVVGLTVDGEGIVDQLDVLLPRWGGYRIYHPDAIESGGDTVTDAGAQAKTQTD